jgi:hypothetical protein
VFIQTFPHDSDTLSSGFPFMTSGIRANLALPVNNTTAAMSGERQYR